MLHRLTRIVLLGAVAFWAIGAATYLHELIEHGEVTCSSSSDRENPPTSKHSHRSRAHDPADHDDCPTCQLLAHMSVTSAAPPTALPVDFPPIAAAGGVDWHPPIALLQLRAFIRGPPGQIT